MNTRTRFLFPSLVVSAALALFASDCSDGVDAAERAAPSAQAASAQAAPTVSVADESLAPYQAELLDLAFQAVSKMPAVPHIKNRSRGQEEVVEAALALGQPQRARSYGEKIENWRRGAAFADLAFYVAQKGDAAEARHLGEIADGIAEELAQRIGQEDDGSAFETPQDWQRDRIRTKVARVHALLGDDERASEREAGVVDSETGKVRAVKAMLAEEDDFDAQMQALGDALLNAPFEQVRTGLDSYVQLYDRFFASAQRRESAKNAIESSWKPLPVQVRIELTSELAEAALKHGDQATALALVNEGQDLLDNNGWTPDTQAELRAGLAALRHRAGDVTKARAEADKALSLFEAKRDEIVDIYRAGVLRSLAQAYLVLGDQDLARKLYANAIEAGVANPNSRPRADDLSATCLSMAQHGFEPDAALRERLRAIQAALGDPW